MVVYDKMPDENPAHDPDGGKYLMKDEDNVEYIIHSSLHDMILGAQQEPSILIVD